MDFMSLLSTTGGTAATFGFAVGALAVAGAATVKGFLDHRAAAVTGPDTTSRPNARREAREQMRALDNARVAAGTPAGGQFAARDRADGSVQL